MAGRGSGGGEEIPIAIIGRPRGNRGEVILHPHFDLRRESLEDKTVVLRFPDGSISERRILRLWWHKERTICLLDGSTSINDAKELTHVEIFIERDELNPLEDDEYFAADLIGCQVFLEDGTSVGEVIGAEDRGAPLLTLRGREDRELLIPFAGKIVVEVDLESRRLVIAPPQGLLEINED
jgi:16S rRNA processing protein RimM